MGVKNRFFPKTDGYLMTYAAVPFKWIKARKWVIAYTVASLPSVGKNTPAEET